MPHARLKMRNLDRKSLSYRVGERRQHILVELLISDGIHLKMWQHPRECMKGFLDSRAGHCLLSLPMSRLPRIFVTAIIALWLPLCCCQLSAFASDFSCVNVPSCCENSCSESGSGENGGGSMGESDRESPVEDSTPHSCSHCVVKAPAPQPPALDSFFVMSVIPFTPAFAAITLDTAPSAACLFASSWTLPPPLKHSERRARLSIWVL